MKSIHYMMMILTLCNLHIDAALPAQDKTALELLGAMQAASNVYENIQIQKQSIDYAKLHDLKNIFAQSLQAYIITFGQVYEQQGGLFNAYQNTYYIASKNNKTNAITPQEYQLLLETLQQAAKLFDWSSNLMIQLPIAKKGLIVQEHLPLHKIIQAIQQVPLPANYSVTSVLTTAAALGALAIGGYLVYNSFQSNPISNIPTQNNLQKKESTILATSTIQQKPLTLEEEIEFFKRNDPQGFAAWNNAIQQDIDNPGNVIEQEDEENDGRFSTTLLNTLGSAATKIGATIDDNIIIPDSWHTKKKETPGELYNTNDFTSRSKKPFAKGLQYYMKHYGTDAAAADQIAPTEKYIKPSKAESYIGTGIKMFTQDALTHSIKEIMDVPAQTYNVAEHITSNILNPSPELKQQVDNYIASVDAMSAEQAYEHFVEHGTLQSESDTDQQITTNLTHKISGVTMGPMIMKQAGKFAFNRLDALRSAGKEVGSVKIVTDTIATSPILKTANTIMDNTAGLANPSFIISMPTMMKEGIEFYQAMQTAQNEQKSLQSNAALGLNIRAGGILAERSIGR